MSAEKLDDSAKYLRTDCSMLPFPTANKNSMMPKRSITSHIATFISMMLDKKLLLRKKIFNCVIMFCSFIFTISLVCKNTHFLSINYVFSDNKTNLPKIFSFRNCLSKIKIIPLQNQNIDV